MKLLRLLSSSLTEAQPTRCDAACRDRGRREAIYDAAAQNAIRI
jgi:hypothetical protein